MCVFVCSVLVVRMCVYVSVVYEYIVCMCVLCMCMHIKTRKMVPITGRVSSFLEIFVCTYVRFQKQNRKEKETEQQ